MIVNELEKMIIISKKENKNPIMVVAMAGTTLYGAYDTIDEINNICKKYKLWLHVDGGWGGSLIFSRRYKYLFNGIQHADSITWNPHKMLQIPFQCSILILKNKNIAKKCNFMNVEYLFSNDKFYDTALDTGNKYVQCGRRVDIMKLWIAWKTRGEDQFEKDIDKIMDLSMSFRNKIRSNKNFKLINLKPQCTNICFWISDRFDNNQYLSAITKNIKKIMIENGEMMISIQSLTTKTTVLPNFFRIVFINPLLEDIDINIVRDMLLSYLSISLKSK